MNQSWTHNRMLPVELPLFPPPLVDQTSNMPMEPLQFQAQNLVQEQAMHQNPSNNMLMEPFQFQAQNLVQEHAMHPNPSHTDLPSIFSHPSPPMAYSPLIQTEEHQNPTMEMPTLEFIDIKDIIRDTTFIPPS